MATRKKSAGNSAEGTLVAKGKTKELRTTTRPDQVDVYELDDITAGNGKRHDVLPGKGELSTTTTCNVFEFLRTNNKGLRLAYLERTGPRSFLALKCEMVPLEVVIRGENAGSYSKRNPKSKLGERFKQPVVEFYLKTNGEVWVGSDKVKHKLPVDDPFLSFDFEQEVFGVHDPREPINIFKPLFTIPFSDVGVDALDIPDIEDIAHTVFGTLEKGLLKAAKARLKDMKIELGWHTKRGGKHSLYVADEIGNDSWRLDLGGREVSKENYRQGAPLPEVLKDYQLVAKLSGQLLGSSR